MVEFGNPVLWSAWRQTRPSMSRACMWPTHVRNLCNPCCPSSHSSAPGLAAQCSLLAVEPCLAPVAGPNWTWTSLAASSTCVIVLCLLPRPAVPLDGQRELSRPPQLPLHARRPVQLQSAEWMSVPYRPHLPSLAHHQALLPPPVLPGPLVCNAPSRT